MFCIKFGEYGFIYGGNFFGCVVVMIVFDVFVKEDFVNWLFKFGEIFWFEFVKFNFFFIKFICGWGLFNGVVIDEIVSKKGRIVW